MRAVAYARVSSAGQRDRETIGSQLKLLPEYVARQGWTLVRPIETYVDDGRSAKAGVVDKRTGLAKLLRDASSRAFDVVVMVDLNRLTRSEDIAERGALLGAFQRAGVKIALASTGQVLDLSTSIGDLFGTLQTFFAAEDNRKRTEAVMRGKLLAAQRGGKITGRDPYGLKYTKPNRWTLDPVRAPIAREIVERVAAGESCYAIAEDLTRRGVHGPGRNAAWHRGRVYDLVLSRHTVGEYTAHEETNTIVQVPRIVDDETWERAQQQLSANRKTPLRKTKHVYLLEGLARCGACGGRMLVQSGFRRGSRGQRLIPSFYLCEHRKNRKVGPDRCAAPRVLVADVDARLWAGLVREIEDPGLPDELAAERHVLAVDAKDWEADADEWRAKLARLDDIEAEHLANRRRGLIGQVALERELVALRRERGALRAQLQTAERAGGAKKSARARAGEAVETIQRLRSKLEAATPADRRSFVVLLVNPGGVTFHGTSIRVELFIPRPSSSEHGVSDGNDSSALVAGSF